LFSSKLISVESLNCESTLNIANARMTEVMPTPSVQPVFAPT